MKKGNLGEKEFYSLIDALKKKINVIYLGELTSYIAEATEICPDVSDISYFALALKLNIPI